MKPVVAFGEIMIRVDMPGHRRLRQAMPGLVEVSFAGAEANVAMSLANFGGSARLVTALPDHSITEACISVLNGLNVDTRYILRTKEGRFGLYYVETGANQRPSTVVYDRERASVSLVEGDRYPWPEIFGDAAWFHVTGITPALSRQAADAVRLATAEAQKAGLTVSCDLNYRSRLWNWKPGVSPSDLARETMRGVLPNVHVVIANEEDAAMVLGIRAKDTDVEAGKLAADRYPEVAREIVRRFPNVRQVAITLRESFSATHNNWGGMLYDASGDAPYFAPLREGRYTPYEIRSIVDRVGGGDAFAGALIFALSTPDLAEPSRAVAFAAAASCLAHSIHGDFNHSSRKEVEALMGGLGSGRVVR